jgi:soluble lytic murein transglycosylase-like protein
MVEKKTETSPRFRHEAGHKAAAGLLAAASIFMLYTNNAQPVRGAELLAESVADEPRVEPAATMAPVPTEEPQHVLAPLFTPEVLFWEKKIDEWSLPFGLDPNLSATVMQIESCGAPYAVSGSNAQGLFQVMPFHFSPGEDMQDPDTNAARGLAYLAGGLKLAGGDAGLALAGYNGGHSRITLDSYYWTQETKRYYYWGSGIYADAVAGLETSPRLEEWLQAASGLCRLAAEQQKTLTPES